MNKAGLGVALMRVGGCLAITLLAAFLLTSHGEGGSTIKLGGLFIAELAMLLVLVVGYHLRFVSAKRTHRQQQRR